MKQETGWRVIFQAFTEGPVVRLGALAHALSLCLFPLISVSVGAFAIYETSQGRELLEILNEDIARSSATFATAGAIYWTAATFVSATIALDLFRRGEREDLPERAEWNAFVWGGLPAVLAILGFFASSFTAAAEAAWPLYMLLLLIVIWVLCFGAFRQDGFIKHVQNGGYVPDKRMTWSIAAALLIAGLILFAGVLIDNVRWPRRLGPFVLLLAALGFWSLLATIAFVWAPKRVHLPSLAWLPFVLAAIFSSYNDNHDIRATIATLDAKPAPPAGAEFRPHLEKWLLARSQETASSRIPVVVVAAEGGGLRAAYWTKAVLTKLDQATDGRFSRHVFAISSVSGGSLGAAVFVAGLAQADRQARPLGPEEVAARTKAFLTQDHLSPVLAAALFPDFLQRFLPVPIARFDRARALEKAWEESWADLFGDASFQKDLVALWRDETQYRLPALILNATQLESGRRVLVSNLILPGDDFPDAYFLRRDEGHQIDAMPLSTAVHLSARFPFLSPTATVKLGDGKLMVMRGAAGKGHAIPDGLVWGRIADGGYFDNSGTITALEVLKAIGKYVAEIKQDPSTESKLRDVEVALHIVMIPNNPLTAGTIFYPIRSPNDWPSAPVEMLIRNISDDVLKQQNWLSELVGPPMGLLMSREAGSAHARATIVKHVNDGRNNPYDDCADKLKGSSRSSKCSCASKSIELGLGVYLRELWADRILDRYDRTWLMSKLARERNLEPALGWYLSKTTMRLMDDVLEKPAFLPRTVFDCAARIVARSEPPPRQP